MAGTDGFAFLQKEDYTIGRSIWRGIHYIQRQDSSGRPIYFKMSKNIQKQSFWVFLISFQQYKKNLSNYLTKV